MSTNLGNTALVSRDLVDPSDPIYGSYLNDTGITPLGFKLLVEIPDPEKTVAEGLIQKPDSAITKEKVGSVVAKVLQLGADCYTDPSRYFRGAWCKPGDYVAMSPYTGTRIASPVTKAELRFINEDAIDGVVPSPDFIERA